MPDRPAGRGQQPCSPPVAIYAKEHGLPLVQTPNLNNEKGLLEELRQENIDFFLVLAFAQFLGEEALRLPKMGCFNIHTSLLPKYRGAAPIQHALMNGDQETGVTIQKMVKSMDAGDIALVKKVPIGANETGGQLYARLKFEAALSTNFFIEEIIQNKLNLVPQDHSLATLAPSLKKEDGHLHFDCQPIEKISKLVRALHPWPGTYCFVNDKRLIIQELVPIERKIAPGTLCVDEGILIIGALDGCLRLPRIQWEGKKVLSDEDWIKGLQNKNGPWVLK